MTMLILHKVNTKPTGPDYGASALHMVKTEKGIVPHKAWRILVTTIGNIEINAMRLDQITVTGGDGSGTPFDSGHYSDKIGANLFNGIDSWWQAPTGTLPQHAGKIYDVPQAWAELTLLSKSGDKPDNFQIQYSDDTTNGTDGTWIDSAVITNQTSTWPSGASTVTIPSQFPESTLTMNFSNNVGDKLHMGVSADYISDQLTQGILEDGHLIEVTDITARDALTLTANTYVLVLDCTGDPDITSGWGLYDYDVTEDTYRLARAENSSVPIIAEEW